MAWRFRSNSAKPSGHEGSQVLTVTAKKLPPEDLQLLRPRSETSFRKIGSLAAV